MSGGTPELQRVEIQGQRPRVGEGSVGRESESPPDQLGGLGEHCKLQLPQQGLGRRPDRKHILDLLRVQKMCLVAANVGRSLIFLLITGGPTEPLDTTETWLENTALVPHQHKLVRG